MLAISVDPPATNAEVIAKQQLAFEILSDEQRRAIHDYGLVHALAPGREIAIPAQILVRPDGSVAWSHVARVIQDRAYPSETLGAIAALGSPSH